MTNRQRMVVGFAFRGSYVALIEKARPEWQRGHQNGIGGHIEAGETDAEAMRREFREETGIDVEEWEHFATLSTDHGTEVVFFRHRFDQDAAYPQLQQLTDEPVGWYSAYALPDSVLPNLHWLIPMSLNEPVGRGMPYQIVEAGCVTPNAVTATPTPAVG